jgi:hypothetical protein
MDDVIDLRTRLIYASLQDEELVHQLLTARAAASRGSVAGPTAAHRPPSGTRPWLATIAPPQASDLMDTDVTATDDDPNVVDVRDAAAPFLRAHLDDPTAGDLVVRHRASEWSTDDPSYYLG